MPDSTTANEVLVHSAGDVELDRRRLLKHGFIWGGLGATAGAIELDTATAAPGRPARGKPVVYDVACLGTTLRIILAPGAKPPVDLLGSAFYVEGAIYHGQTIKGTGFDPSKATRLGTWICRGWFMVTAGRGEPHVITTQEYVLGRITPARLFPPTSLVSSGTEGSDREGQAPVRAVIGGTGRFSGARGTVIQHGNGTNTTKLVDPALGELGPAPNFRFEFRLR